MKRKIAWILILVLAMGLGACAAEETESITPPPTRETVQYGHPETEPAPTQLPQPEQETARVEVRDVFADKAVMMDFGETYYYHIPSIQIPGVDTAQVNKQMYDELYSFIDQYVYDNPDYPYLGNMGYLWGERQGIVSVITEVVVGPDSSPNPLYVVYHVDAATGLRISDEEFLERLGPGADAWREQVRARLDSTFLRFYGENQGDFYEQQYAKTISDENVNNVIPYIDPSGELCLVADIYSMAGGDSYRNLISLSGNFEPAHPRAEPFE